MLSLQRMAAFNSNYMFLCMSENFGDLLVKSQAADINKAEHQYFSTQRQMKNIWIKNACQEKS
jgi:hypothetical protein